MERSKDPNKGLMSPPGGKLKTEEAESPSQCAVREVYEECLLHTSEADWILKGIVTEKDYPKAGNIMLFLMEYKNLLNRLPEVSNEGRFYFIHPDNFKKYKLPVTDNLFLWKNLFQCNGEIFILSLDCSNYPQIKRM